MVLVLGRQFGRATFFPFFTFDFLKHWVIVVARTMSGLRIAWASLDFNGLNTVSMFTGIGRNSSLVSCH
jgi:hypothetical protein